MKTQKTFLKNRFGERLEAEIKCDGKKKKYPAILFISGFGQDLHEYANSFDEIAKELVKEGFLTIQFSFAGCGQSEGNYQKTTLQRQASQIKDIFEFIRKNPKVETERVGILAQSFGVPSLIVALPLEAQSLIFVSGVVNAYRSIKEIFVKRKSFNPRGVSALPRSNGALTSVGPEFWQDLKKHKDLSSLVETYRGPILILHGSADNYVSANQVKKFYQAISVKKTLKIYKKGDHGIEFPKEKRQEFLQDIVNWFEKTL